MPTVAELIVEGLLRAEVPRIFGVPGGGSNLEVLEAARARGLPFVLCHQEWAATIMAFVKGGSTTLAAFGLNSWWGPFIPAVLVIVFFRWLGRPSRRGPR